MRRFLFALLLLLQPGTDTYITRDGALTLTVPAGWVVSDETPILFLTNTPANLPSGYPTGSGQAWISVQLFSAATLNLPSDATPAVALRAFSRSYDPITDLTIGTRRAATAAMDRAPLESQVMVVEVAPGQFVIMDLLTWAGERALYQDTYTALAASLNYDASRVFDPLLWQVQDTTSAVGLYQDVALGTNDRLYVAVNPDTPASASRIDLRNAVDGALQGAIPLEAGVTITALAAGVDSVRVLIGDEVRHYHDDGTLLGRFDPQTSTASDTPPLFLDMAAAEEIFILSQTVSAAGRIVNQVGVWGLDGQFRRAFPVTVAENPTGENGFIHLAADADRLVLADRYGGLRIFTPDGLLLDTLTPQVGVITGLSLAPDGAFILTTTKNQLVRLRPDGTPQTYYGSRVAGTAPYGRGEFAAPGAVVALASGQVILCDAVAGGYTQVVRLWLR